MIDDGGHAPCPGYSSPKQLYRMDWRQLLSCPYLMKYPRDWLNLHVHWNLYVCGQFVLHPNCLGSNGNQSWAVVLRQLLLVYRPGNLREKYIYEIVFWYTMKFSCFTSLFTHGRVSVPLPIPEPDPVPEADSLVLPILLLDASESLLDSVTAPR